MPDLRLQATGGAGAAMPTGRVVGILQRNWRSYVVTMQEGEADKIGGSKVLLTWA